MKKILTALSAVATMSLMLSGCGAAGTADAAAGSPASSFVLLAAMFAVMYLVIIRPEKKRKKQADEMRSGVAVGDKITTIGGMVGSVVHVTNDRVTFECGEDRVRIEVMKWAISANEGKGASKEKSDSEETLDK